MSSVNSLARGLPVWSQRGHLDAPAALKPWLCERGSLTAKLQRLAAFKGQRLQVRVLSQRWQRPCIEEARALGMRAGQLALVRSVVLGLSGEDWVFAHSVLPMTTLTGPLYRLRKLDNTPLGALLFAEPSMQRSAIESAALRPSAHYLPAALFGHRAQLWARRSIFRLHDKPLLVSEVFLPPLTDPEA